MDKHNCALEQDVITPERLYLKSVYSKSEFSHYSRWIWFVSFGADAWKPSQRRVLIFPQSLSVRTLLLQNERINKLQPSSLHILLGETLQPPASWHMPHLTPAKASYQLSLRFKGQNESRCFCSQECGVERLKHVALEKQGKAFVSN